MNNLYIYVKKIECEKCLKYGIKLSEYANKLLDNGNTTKKCILAYLCPKDSEKFCNKNYICLKVNLKDLQVYITNEILENTKIEKKFLIKSDDYKLGSYEYPIALICTTILPENLSLYNDIIDSPILFENSKDFFYEKSINEMIENNMFSNSELYKAMLILSESKGTLEKILDEGNIKAYINKIDKKIYTSISKF